MKPGFFKQLCEIAGKENVRTDEPMKQHTTFRIGGAPESLSPRTSFAFAIASSLLMSTGMEMTAFVFPFTCTGISTSSSFIASSS